MLLGGLLCQACLAFSMIPVGAVGPGPRAFGAQAPTTDSFARVCPGVCCYQLGVLFMGVLKLRAPLFICCPC